jgi:hypothetical protein
MLYKPYPKNIICFEGNWNENDPTNAFSILPILEYLRDNGEIKLVYKRVSTKEQLQYEIRELNKSKTRQQFELIYFAFHGDKNCIYINRKETITLKDLASYQGKYNFFENKIIHFSCCSTAFNKKQCLTFREDTEARVVSGFKKSVDFHISTAFDLLYLGMIQRYKSPSSIRKYMFNNHDKLVKDIGFVFYPDGE